MLLSPDRGKYSFFVQLNQIFMETITSPPVTTEGKIMPQTENLAEVKISTIQLKKAAGIVAGVIGLANNPKPFFGDYWFTPEQMLAQYNFSHGPGWGRITLEDLLNIFEETHFFAKDWNGNT